MRHISPKTKKLIRFAAFLLIFILLFGHVQKILTHSDVRSYHWIHGFYDEDEDSLDAVYIGSSATYAFWNSLYGWKNYGITVYPYCSPAMPMQDLVDLVKDIHKTQPNALIIVGYNTVYKPAISYEVVHYLVDYMPFSANKLSVISHYSKEMGLSLMDRMEFYFPIIRYHDRWPWSSLDYQDFTYANDGLKGASHYSVYLDRSQDVTENQIITDEIGVLAEDLKKSFDDLCAYCEEEDVRLLFVLTPQARDNVEYTAVINAATQYLEEKGADVLNLLNSQDEIGLDLANDYYNKLHTNIHGSAKFSSYFAEYLMDKYGFTDKRGESGYESWDEGVALYTNEGYMQRLLDFEQDAAERDYSIEVPANLEVFSVDGSDDSHVDVTLSWSPSEGADGYSVYVKLSGQQLWNLAADTDGGTAPDENALIDSAVVAADLESAGQSGGITASEDGRMTLTFSHAERKFTFYYRVVPYAVVNGEKVYGNYSVPGIMCIGPDSEEAAALNADDEEILAGEDEEETTGEDEAPEEAEDVE